MTGFSAAEPSGFPHIPEPNRSFLLALGATARSLKAGFQQYVGISETRLRLLAHLTSDRELSQSDLQRHLRVDGAAITRQVKQMEAEGLLARRPDPADNRFTLVGLTPAGAELVRSLAAKGQEFEQLVLKDMGRDEIACTVDLLARLRENLAAQELRTENQAPAAALRTR